jgi:hypothetical protein
MKPKHKDQKGQQKVQQFAQLPRGFLFLPLFGTETFIRPILGILCFGATDLHMMALSMAGGSHRS